MYIFEWRKIVNGASLASAYRFVSCSATAAVKYQAIVQSSR